MSRLYPKHPFVGIGAIIIQDGNILLEKRASEPGKGKWSIPGGLVELGESIESAVIREVREETGLEVEEPVLMDVVDNVTIDKEGKVKFHFVIIDFFVKSRFGECVASSDAEEVRWVPLDQVEEYELTKTFREFFIHNRKKLEISDSTITQS